MSVELGLAYSAQVVSEVRGEVLGDHTAYASVKPLLWCLGLQRKQTMTSLDPPNNPVIGMTDSTVIVFM